MVFAIRWRISGMERYIARYSKFHLDRNMFDCYFLNQLHNMVNILTFTEYCTLDSSKRINDKELNFKNS